MNNFSGLFVVLLISVITACGDFCMKLAGNSGTFINIKWFLFGMALYMVTGVGWFVAMRSVKMSSIGVIYGVTTVILLAIIGVLFFDEKLNWLEIAAILMGISSIVLLVRFS